jgi:uncharacterized membrane protein
MNAAHLHLLVNHLPIAGLGFAFLLNLIAVGRKSDELQRLSCWSYVLLAILAIPPILTGDGAGEIVKTWPGISADAIEYHETWGYLFFYSMLALGITGLIPIVMMKNKPSLLKPVSRILLVASFLFLALAFEAGLTGGKIHHPEMETGIYQK